MHGRGLTELPHSDRDDWRNLRAISPYLREYLGRVAIAVLCLFAAKLVTVGAPLVLKAIVDSLDRQATAIVLPLALFFAYGLLRLASVLFTELRDGVFSRVRHRAMRKLATQVVQHLFNLGLRFHLDRKTGGISRDIERGTRSVSELLNLLSFNIVPTLFEFSLVAAILAIQYSPGFAVITLGVAIFYIVFTLYVTEWRMPFRLRMNKFDSAANTRAIDGLLNYETVKYFGNEAYEVRRYDEVLAQWEDAAVKSQFSLSVLNIGQGVVIAVGVTWLMVLAGSGVAAGTMTLGDLVLINAFMLQLFIPLNFLGTVYRMIRHALADMDLLFKLLRETPEIVDQADAAQLRVADGAVGFEGVSFGYDPRRPILRDLDIGIKPGEKVAVVGASGAGKSTLARLLFRFYDVDGGRIVIDDQDIRRVTQESLREAIGVVPQDTVLFNDSIYFNIAYARPDAQRSQIEAAARAAHLHNFIASLPDGYDTVVGERGLKLSGGEKQRVAIARVILKNPPILVFDEATSSLDSDSEQAILTALKEIARQRTTLVIAHRLSTIVDAEQILVMGDGRIMERGTHQQLLARGGVYARMWELQQKETAAEPA